MRRLPIAPPERGQCGKGAYRVLAGRNHPTRVTGQSKCVPPKMKEYYSTGGIADSLPDFRIEPANRLAEVEYGIKRRGFSGSEGARDRARFVLAHRLGGVAFPVCRGLEFGPRKSSWPPCRRCL